jgi:hypothetical protein
MKTREEIMKVIEVLKAKLIYAKKEVSSYTSNVEGFKKDIKESMEMIRDLEKRLQELKEEPYIKARDTCYYANYCGEINECQAHEDSNTNPAPIEAAGLHTGNISKSKSYITETEKMVQLTRRLRLFLEMEGYKDWEPDWEDENEEKWCIRYIYEDKHWYVYCDILIQQQGTVYFPFPELADKAIEEVVKPLEREWMV